MAGKTAGKRKEIVTDKELAMAMRDVMRHDPTGRSVYRSITSGKNPAASRRSTGLFDSDSDQFGDEEDDYEEEGDEEEGGGEEAEEKVPIKKTQPARIKPAKTTKTIKPARIPKVIKDEKDIALLTHADPRLSAISEGQAQTGVRPPQCQHGTEILK